MPVATSAMLDFGLLQTPKEHGDVLVLPEPGAWIEAARQNAARLNACDVPLLDSTLGAWRRKTREAVIGNDSGLTFVTGHQPEFIHPGVWAKHVVAARAAAAEGVAYNLVVDNDSPQNWSMMVPTFNGGVWDLSSIAMGQWKRGLAYDQFPALGVDVIKRVREQVAAAVGSRLERTPMNLYLDSLAESPFNQCGTGILPVKTRWLEANTTQMADVGQQAPKTPVHDWVTQTVTARRRVEGSFGVHVVDRRVSEVWCSPLMVDMLIHADRFASAYNKALAKYRTAHHVRGAQRPIPDLHVESDRTEVAVWAYRQGEPRRRLFVTRVTGFRGAIRLDADGVDVGEVPAKHLRCCEDLAAVLGDLSGWFFRPRALTLTLWARLLLADLFIHGIGGAKYDRITDTILKSYYGVEPPHMACVSATLKMNLPDCGGTEANAGQRSCFEPAVWEAKQALRDFGFNPQRHVAPVGEAAHWIEQKERAVQQSMALRSSEPRGRRGQRREVFDEIRRLNRSLACGAPEVRLSREASIQRARDNLLRDRIAQGREYFFALYEREALELLCARLPSERAFRL